MSMNPTYKHLQRSSSSSQNDDTTSIISFKFKNEVQYDWIRFRGESITLRKAKELIAQKRQLGLTEKYELVLYDS
jgi:hypothetical protein